MLNGKLMSMVFALLIFSSVALGQSGLEVSRSIDGTVKPGETIDVVITIKISGETPSSVIVTESIPDGWELTDSKPNANLMDGKYKFLIYGSNLKEVTKIEYAIKAPSDFSGSETISGDWSVLGKIGGVEGDALITETPEPVQQESELQSGQQGIDMNIILIMGLLVVIILLIMLVFKKR